MCVEAGPPVALRCHGLAAARRAGLEDVEKLYPDVPIVFNIVTRQPLGPLRGKLERELRSLRAQLANEKLKNSVQIIWRS